MSPERPYTLVAELTYRCPLQCVYCSNPLDIGGEHYRYELETEHWIRAFEEARKLGVLQLALTGGEPMLRRDLDELCAAARDAGLYSSLITAGTLFTRARAEALKAAGLDHVQISIQSPDPADNDRIAGNRSFEKKIAAARWAREIDFPLTINCVLHRHNLDRIEELLDLAEPGLRERLALAEGAEVVVYCHVGSRSGIAVQVLRTLGYDARNYAGSWHEWSRTELPLEL